MNNMNQITQNNIITIIEENDMNVSNQKMEFNNNLNSNNILNNINDDVINNIEKSKEKNYDNNSKSNNQCAGSNSKYAI